MVRQIAVDDADSVFIAAGPVLFASHDAGDSWQRLAEGLLMVQALVAVCTLRHPDVSSSSHIPLIPLCERG